MMSCDVMVVMYTFTTHTSLVTSTSRIQFTIHSQGWLSSSIGSSSIGSTILDIDPVIRQHHGNGTSILEWEKGGGGGEHIEQTALLL